jgi:hypothetical protein
MYFGHGRILAVPQSFIIVLVTKLMYFSIVVECNCYGLV